MALLALPTLPLLTQQHIGSMNGMKGVTVWGHARLLTDSNKSHGDTIYFSIVGPPTLVDVVWSKLMMNERGLSASIGRQRLTIMHEGIPGEVRRSKKHKNGKSPYMTVRKRLAGVEYDHLMFIDWRFIYPNYDAATGASFLFEADTLPIIVGQRVQQLVDIPIFNHWLPHLARLGYQHKLLKPALNGGEGQRVWSLNMDREKWQTTISAALAGGQLSWDKLTDMDEAAILQETLSLIAKPAKPSTPDPTPTAPQSNNDAPFSITFTSSQTRVSFQEKPAVAVRTELKKRGFRWNKGLQAWTRWGEVEDASLRRALQDIAS